jgi:hypothetical protein
MRFACLIVCRHACRPDGASEGEAPAIACAKARGIPRALRAAVTEDTIMIKLRAFALLLTLSGLAVACSSAEEPKEEETSETEQSVVNTQCATRCEQQYFECTAAATSSLDTCLCGNSRVTCMQGCGRRGFLRPCY